MTTQVQLQAWLTEAEAAYHSIQTGRQIKVFVDQNGERIEYSTGNSARLFAYIQWLKNQLGLGTVQGPLHIWF